MTIMRLENMNLSRVKEYIARDVVSSVLLIITHVVFIFDDQHYQSSHTIADHFDFVKVIVVFSIDDCRISIVIVKKLQLRSGIVDIFVQELLLLRFNILDLSFTK